LTRQLAFDLPIREARGRDDFFVAPSNALALAALDAWRDWPGGKLVLVGPGGSGKTHLAQVWSSDLGAKLVSATELASHDPPLLAQGPVSIENADIIAGQPALETALFHLHNLLAENRQPLLLTASTPPRDWGMCLPDLASRVQAAQVARIETPDETLLCAVLMKQFQDRQLAVAPSVITGLAREMERSLSLVRAVVAQIDARALAEGGTVTRSMALATLRALAGQHDETS
jgi:chromosomal replication initiation ATPase DnaA